MEFLLSSLVLMPLAGALCIGVSPRRRPGLIKSMGLFFAVCQLGLALLLYIDFDPGISGMQFVERYAWIASMGLYFHLGVDGISLFLVLLTIVLTLLVMLADWPGVEAHLKEYTCAVLALSSALVAAFVALDLLLFYICCEASVLLISFLIGIGGRRRRIYASLHTALYSFAMGLPFLVALLYLADYHRQINGQFHFGVLQLYELTLPLEAQLWPLLAFFFYFAARLALFPLHTWLSTAQVAAPLPLTILLAGVALKVGGYGLLRFCLPLFPEAFYNWSAHIAAVATVGVVYGALLAMVQDDLQKVVACASTSQMALVVLGIAALNLQGLQGSLIYMINHGVATAALLLIAGGLYRRFQTQELVRFGGLSQSMPLTAAFFLVALLAFVGLPGLGGFAGVLAILLGSYERFAAHAVMAVLAVILMAWRGADIFQHSMWGEKKATATDMGWRELGPVVSLLLISLWFGFYPGTLLQRTEGAVEQVLVRVGAEVQSEFVEGE